jgi:hypothetical protein
MNHIALRSPGPAISPGAAEPGLVGPFEFVERKHDLGAGLLQPGNPAVLDRVEPVAGHRRLRLDQPQRGGCGGVRDGRINWPPPGGSQPASTLRSHKTAPVTACCARASVWPGRAPRSEGPPASRRSATGSESLAAIRRAFSASTHRRAMARARTRPAAQPALTVAGLPAATFSPVPPQRQPAHRSADQYLCGDVVAPGRRPGPWRPDRAPRPGPPQRLPPSPPPRGHAPVRRPRQPAPGPPPPSAAHLAWPRRRSTHIPRGSRPARREHCSPGERQGRGLRACARRFVLCPHGTPR